MKELIIDIIKQIEETPNDMELGKKNRDLYLLRKDSLKEIEPNEDDKYIRLLAEFDNFKKRTIQEKSAIKDKATMDSIEPMLTLYDELTLSLKTISDENTIIGINLMLDKVSKSLKNLGIEEIQTETYDPEVHDVISVLGNSDSNKIIDVISKGYTINGNIFKHPKVVIG